MVSNNWWVPAKSSYTKLSYNESDAHVERGIYIYIYMIERVASIPYHAQKSLLILPLSLVLRCCLYLFGCCTIFLVIYHAPLYITVAGSHACQDNSRVWTYQPFQQYFTLVKTSHVFSLSADWTELISFYLPKPCQYYATFMHLGILDYTTKRYTTTVTDRRNNITLDAKSGVMQWFRHKESPLKTVYPREVECTSCSWKQSWPERVIFGPHQHVN